MKCEDVGRLLSFEDGDARVDRLALAEHVASCDGCGRAYPEIAWLMGQVRAQKWESGDALPEVELEPTRSRFVIVSVAAAAALLLATIVGLRSLLSTSEDEPAPEQVAIDNQVHEPEVESAPGLEPTRSSPASTSTSTLVTWHKGRRVTSSVERSVWRPNNRHSNPSEIQR